MSFEELLDEFALRLGWDPMMMLDEYEWLRSESSQIENNYFDELLALRERRRTA